MSNLTASLRLNFSAQDGPLSRAIAKMRELRQASNDFFKKGRDAETGQFTASPFQKMTGDFFKPSKEAFKLANHIGQAAHAMGEFKAQLDGVTRGPIEDFAAFEKAMANVKGKTDDITNTSFIRLRDSAREIGRTSQFNAQQAAEGYGELAAAGLGAANQLAALPPIMKLATASQMALGDTTHIAIATMHQFGMKTENLAEIGDILTQGFNASSIELGQLGESLSYVGPIAHTAGLSLKSTVGFVALLGNAGIEGSRGGTALSATLARLANITPRSAKALAQMGLSARDMAKGVSDPVTLFAKMEGAMTRHHFDKAQRLSALVRIFGSEAAPAVATMMEKASVRDAKTGKTGFENIQDQMDHNAGAMDRFGDAIQDTTDYKLKRFDAQMQDLKLSMGESFAPVLVDLNKSMGPVLHDFGAWIKENPRLVSTMGRVALGVSAVLGVVGPLALGISSLATVWGVLGPAMRMGIMPVKLAGSLFSGLRTKMLQTGTGLGRLGAAFTGFAAVASAALAGWEVGKYLDEAIGKMLKLRGGLLSTEMALNAGESGGFNDLVEGVGRATGSKSLRDFAEGNRTANATRLEADQASHEYREPAKVDVNVNIKDERTIVHHKTRRTPGVAPRVGSNLP